MAVWHYVSIVSIVGIVGLNISNLIPHRLFQEGTEPSFLKQFGWNRKPYIELTLIALSLQLKEPG